MHLRETAGRGGLVALIVALLPSCTSVVVPRPVEGLDRADAVQLRAVLDSIRSRTDVEAVRARGRIYDRLRSLEDPDSIELLMRGDGWDVDLLSRPIPAEWKTESASRLSRHFRERAEKPSLCRSSYPGAPGAALRRVVLLTVALSFGEYASAEDHAAALERLAAASEDLAKVPELGPEGARHWTLQGGVYRQRLDLVRADPAPREPGADLRKFVESGAGAHLEEGTRAADMGTREKASRRELGIVLHWYVRSLAHFAVVRETQAEPTPAQEHALASQEIVIRSICDLLCREF